MTIENERQSDWIQLVSGEPFWPLEPRAEEVSINDIAWALSMQCRFAGHVKRFYSVAEHSVHISTAVPEHLALWGLLHDAPEAYMCDVPRPVKRYLWEYTKIERGVMAAIAKRYGLEGVDVPREVKDIDSRMITNERDALLVPSTRAWSFTPDPVPNVAIRGWNQDMAYHMFLARFNRLTGKEL